LLVPAIGRKRERGILSKKNRDLDKHIGESPVSCYWNFATESAQKDAGGDNGNRKECGFTR